ncbi:MAG: MBL fold metallo-hydrolase [Phycisphaerae bacterium]|jgi:glyoxylase-like metal-dependent hydrolase (beta-lactamase superfamily II)|nr:MBL fold metallo-hydrolase [Phycisphaerae bacterium]
MQILPNVYLANGFPYSQHQNSYIVKTAGATVMIDSGDLGTDTFEIVRQNCSIWGIDLADISHLLLTHAHHDHSSHAARLQRMGLKIVASADCADAIAAGDDRCVAYALGRPDAFETCKADQIVADGDELEIGELKVRCIAAPGHANSCMIYEIVLDRRRLWFVGDVVLICPECFTVELGWAGGPDYDRTTYLETLRKLCHMDCDCLFSGHGDPCIGGGRRLLGMAYTKAMLEWR